MKRSEERIPVAISSCLGGLAVRYDGKDKKDDAILSEFAPFFRWISVCPEVEIGMGIPREPIQLVQIEGEVRLRGVESEHDWTDRMTAYAEARAAWLVKIGVAGYVLKSRSPSCGVQTVPLYGAAERVPGMRDGLFAAAVRSKLPDLPVREETGLETRAGRLAFLEEVREYAAQV
ncbi:MAG: DUF523 domain-containing protein [Gemmatimonadetes bacterium]|nr:DUF523 domain-containing protein [Gemmatimonadota bacterium]